MSILTHLLWILITQTWKKNTESVLKVLKKIVDLSNSNLQKNADGLLATKPHRNEDILLVGGKRVPEDQSAFSY